MSGRRARPVRNRWAVCEELMSGGGREREEFVYCAHG